MTVSSPLDGPDLGMADALATALVVGVREVLERIDQIAGYEALGIELNGTTQHTRSFPVVPGFQRPAAGEHREGDERVHDSCCPSHPEWVGRALSGHDARGAAGCTIKERRGNGARTRRSSLAGGPTTSSAHLDSR